MSFSDWIGIWSLIVGVVGAVVGIIGCLNLSKANNIAAKCIRSVYKELHADRETGC